MRYGWLALEFPLEQWSAVGAIGAHVRSFLGLPYNVRIVGGLVARLRERYWTYVHRYQCEICQLCGRRVGLVWWASDATWNELVQGGGVICPRCFNRLAQERHVVLVWRPEPDVHTPLQVVGD